MSHVRNLTIAFLGLAGIGLLFVFLVGDRFAQPPNLPVAEIEPTSAHLAAVDQKSQGATYVGRQVCKECHQENFEFHSHSGHASTFFDARDRVIVEKFVDKEYDAGDLFGTFRYFVDDQGSLQVRRLDDSVDETLPLQFALGSGAHGITLLTLVDDPTHGALGIEHRVTWFGTDGELGRTPGHDYIPGTELELFGMAHTGDNLQRCVSCHSTTGKVVGTEIVDLVPNVNCEKCHGPGSEHVQQARQSNSPPPFSIGRADWTAESEFRLCGSCHRLPSDVTRKQLRDYEPDLTRFQPVGLLQSECYLESDFQLRCTHCHNPHQAAKVKSMAAYQQDCIDCHLEDSDLHVACPVSPSDGCIDCHMKGIKLDHGITFHDHWIRVYPE